MSEWIEAAELAVLKRRRKLQVTVEGRDIALFYLNGEVFALDDICIHKQSRLSRGLVFKGCVICPGHQWAFDLRTGWVDDRAQCQPTFSVRIMNGHVYVDPTPRVLVSEPSANEKYGQGG